MKQDKLWIKFGQGKEKILDDVYDDWDDIDDIWSDMRKKYKGSR